MIIATTGGIARAWLGSVGWKKLDQICFIFSADEHLFV